MAYGKPVFVSCRTVLVAPCVRNVASGLLIIAGGRIIALLGGNADKWSMVGMHAMPKASGTRVPAITATGIVKGLHFVCART